MTFWGLRRYNKRTFPPEAGITNCCAGVRIYVLFSMAFIFIFRWFVYFFSIVSSFLHQRLFLLGQGQIEVFIFPYSCFCF